MVYSPPGGFRKQLTPRAYAPCVFLAGTPIHPARSCPILFGKRLAEHEAQRIGLIAADALAFAAMLSAALLGVALQGPTARDL